MGDVGGQEGTADEEKGASRYRQTEMEEVGKRRPPSCGRGAMKRRCSCCSGALWLSCNKVRRSIQLSCQYEPTRRVVQGG